MQTAEMKQGMARKQDSQFGRSKETVSGMILGPH